MLKVITKEVPIEVELKERILFACKYSIVKCVIKNGFNHYSFSIKQKRAFALVIIIINTMYLLLQ